MSKNSEELFEHVKQYIDSPIESDAAIISYLLDNCEIEVPAENRFFVTVGCTEVMNEI